MHTRKSVPETDKAHAGTSELLHTSLLMKKVLSDTNYRQNPTCKAKNIWESSEDISQPGEITSSQPCKQPGWTERWRCVKGCPSRGQAQQTDTQGWHSWGLKWTRLRACRGRHGSFGGIGALMVFWLLSLAPATARGRRSNQPDAGDETILHSMERTGFQDGAFSSRDKSINTEKALSTERIEGF